MIGFAPRIYMHICTGHVHTHTHTQSVACVQIPMYAAVVVVFFLHYDKVCCISIVFIVKLGNAINRPSPKSCPPHALDSKWMWRRWVLDDPSCSPTPLETTRLWVPKLFFFHYKIVTLQFPRFFYSFSPAISISNLQAWPAPKEKGKERNPSRLNTHYLSLHVIHFLANRYPLQAGVGEASFWGQCWHFAQGNETSKANSAYLQSALRN